MKIWVEKYRPKKFSEIVGQNEQIEKVKEYYTKFPKTKKKALLLGGPPGIGKTTMVQVLVKENHAEAFELNASDTRNKSSIIETLKPVLRQASLFKKNKIILIDEVDGISGTKDRGGITELLKLIAISPYPIICTANDLWSKKLSALRKKCGIVELNEISPANIKQVLKKILTNENKQVTLNVLNKIAINSKGDLRSAINDLETASSLKEPEEIILSERNKKENIFNVMKTIFQESPNNEMLRLFDKVAMPLDEISLWIEENIPKVYSKEELKNAYESLAKSNLFKSRIYKKQYWRFLVYQNIFSSYGISAAKGKTEKKGFHKYTKPERILKIWLNNIKHAKRKTIAEKYSKKTHVGTKRILKEFEEIKKILNNPIVQKELKLDSDEIRYIEKSNQGLKKQ